MATVSYTLPDPPLWIQALGGDPDIEYDSVDLRQLMKTLWYTPGRIRPGNFLIAQRAAGADWSIDVSTGKAIVSLSDSASTRAMVQLSGSTQNIALTGFTTNPVATRTHKVWLVVHDKTVAGTLYEGQIVITEDTGSGAPLPSTLTPAPAGYLQIGSFTIAPSQANVSTAHITNLTALADYGDPYTITLNSGYTSAATEAGTVAPQMWNCFGEVKFQGAVKRTSGNFLSNNDYTIANLPLQWQNGRDNYGVVAGQVDGSSGAPNVCQIQLQDDGDLVLKIPNTGWNPSWVSLDGFSYRMS